MMKQSLRSYITDVFIGLAAIVAALWVADYLHGMWFYGEWMESFGDPPMDNPAYSQLSPMFETAPYVAAGVIVGLISGFGRPDPIRIAIRATAPIMLFMLLQVADKQLAGSVYFPTASKVFVFSAMISAIYFWISNSNSKARKTPEQNSALNP